MGVKNLTTLETIARYDAWKDIINPKFLLSILDTGSVHFIWPMQSRSGTVATDFSGNGRHGTYATPTLGHIGPNQRVDSVVTFNGSSDVITAAAGCSVRSLSAFTFVGVINVTASAAIRSIWWESVVTVPGTARLLIRLQADHTLNVNARAGVSADTSLTATTDAPLSAGYHVVHISVNVATSAVVFYVDGVAVASTTTNSFSASSIANTAPAAGPYAGNQEAQTRYYDSTAAYFGMHSKVLTAGECLTQARASGLAA